VDLLRAFERARYEFMSEGRRRAVSCLEGCHYSVLERWFVLFQIEGDLLVAGAAEQWTENEPE
jgi:hypothetical protein